VYPATAIEALRFCFSVVRPTRGFEPLYRRERAMSMGPLDEGVLGAVARGLI